MSNTEEEPFVIDKNAILGRVKGNTNSESLVPSNTGSTVATTASNPGSATSMNSREQEEGFFNTPEWARHFERTIRQKGQRWAEDNMLDIALLYYKNYTVSRKLKGQNAPNFKPTAEFKKKFMSRRSRRNRKARKSRKQRRA
jgi:hypothetical protein